MSADDKTYWINWQLELENRILLPAVSFGDFQDAVRATTAATTALRDATLLRDAIAKQQPLDQKALDMANAAVNSAIVCNQAANTTALDAARQLLLVLQEFLSHEFDDADILTWACITIGTPSYLADYCQKHPQSAEALVTLFGQPEQLRVFVQNGYPSHGKFGDALQLLAALSPNAGEEPVLQRLAIAVALELAAPLDKMVVHSSPAVDPLKRFVHYQQAYLLGELDPAFSQLTVWEMRMAINSDATEDELGWGRESLKNHRPDLVLMEDEQWRYCRIVRTDVGYRDPVFWKEPRSYDQILSNGGKCGPRAWYGRFICKAFGIPTWGVTQPGHAAMSRWTHSGWVICLGAGFRVSYWLDRCGDDFLLETQARRAVEDDERYLEQVVRLEWAAMLAGEAKGLEKLRAKCETDVNFPWTALSYYQRLLLSSSSGGATCNGHKATQRQSSSMIPRFGSTPRPIKGGNAIQIPAEAFTDHSGGSAVIMQSFLGGQQLWLGPSTQVTYKLDASSLVTAQQANNARYRVTLIYNTVHRDEPCLLLTVATSDNANSNDGDDDWSFPTTISQIPIDYTAGIWQESEPIEIEIQGRCISSGNETIDCEFTVIRKAETFGIAIKYIILDPIGYE
jgi:hypothetical protein